VEAFAIATLILAVWFGATAWVTKAWWSKSGEPE